MDASKAVSYTHLDVYKRQTQDVASSTDFQATQAARGQSGDVLEELSKSCTKYDMDMGFYLSPWDANKMCIRDRMPTVWIL